MTFKQTLDAKSGYIPSLSSLSVSAVLRFLLQVDLLLVEALAVSSSPSRDLRDLDSVSLLSDLELGPAAWQSGDSVSSFS